MNNEKALYFKLEYIIHKKMGGGSIKIKLDFNKHHMEYIEIDMDNDVVLKSLFIKGYDYNLAVDVFLEADLYRANWAHIEFF